MRAEIKANTPIGQKVEALVSRGQIVPTEITVELLLKAIKTRKAKRFLIDGFPRGIEQAYVREQRFKEIQCILNFDVPEQVLVERLVKRGLTSGRADDNEETIKARISVFNEST